MARQTSLESAVAKLVVLAQVQGITIEDLLDLLDSGASVTDIVVALSPHDNQYA
jgi:hypothetical protein